MAIDERRSTYETPYTLDETAHRFNGQEFSSPNAGISNDNAAYHSSDMVSGNATGSATGKYFKRRKPSGKSFGHYHGQPKVKGKSEFFGFYDNIDDEFAKLAMESNHDDDYIDEEMEAQNYQPARPDQTSSAPAYVVNKNATRTTQNSTHDVYSDAPYEKANAEAKDEANVSATNSDSHGEINGKTNSETGSLKSYQKGHKKSLFHNSNCGSTTLRGMLIKKSTVSGGKSSEKRRNRGVQRSPVNSTERVNLWNREFNSQRFNLLMGFLGMGLALICLSAFIGKSMESTLVPYIVAVDEHGVVRNQGLVSEYQQSITNEMVFNQLCGFITNMRLISTDKDVQHQAVVKAYAFVKEGTQPSHVLNEFYQSRDAFNQSYKREISVSIANVMAIDQKSLEIEWVEHLSIDHRERDRLRLRARIAYTIGSNLSKNPESVLLNPLNIVITDLRISEALI